MDLIHDNAGVLGMVCEPRVREGGDPQMGRFKADEVNDLRLFSLRSNCHNKDCENEPCGCAEQTAKQYIAQQFMRMLITINDYPCRL